MAIYAENNIYLKFGSTDVSAFFKECKPSFSNATQDVTAGAGTDWVERAPGLNDAKFEISLGYDVDSLQTYIQKLAPGAQFDLEYGPEGATSGKPRHVQAVVVADVGHPVQVDKKGVFFDLSLEATAAPSVDMTTGGVYS